MIGVLITFAFALGWFVSALGSMSVLMLADGGDPEPLWLAILAAVWWPLGLPAVFAMRALDSGACLMLGAGDEHIL